MPGCFTPDGSRLVALGLESKTYYVWDLWSIRGQLRELGLDWDGRPPEPPARPGGPPEPLRITVETAATAGKGDPVARRDELNALLARDPKDVTALVRRAGVQVELHQYAEAFADLDRALGLQPDHVGALHQRALLCKLTGQTERARADADVLVELRPRVPAYRTLRLNVTDETRDPKTCVADLKALADLDPSNDGSAYSLAWLLLCGPDEVRDPAGGLRAAERAAARWPDNVWARTVLALAWYRNGKAREARSALLAVREEAPLRLEPFVLFTLVLCHQELGEADEARAAGTTTATCSGRRRSSSWRTSKPRPPGVCESFGGFWVRRLLVPGWGPGPGRARARPGGEYRVQHVHLVALLLKSPFEGNFV